MNYLTWELYFNIVVTKETIVLNHLLFCKRIKEVKSKTKKQFYWWDAPAAHPHFWSLAKSSQSIPKVPRNVCSGTNPVIFLPHHLYSSSLPQTPLEGETLSESPLFLTRMLSDRALKPQFPYQKADPDATQPIPKPRALQSGLTQPQSLGLWWK